MDELIKIKLKKYLARYGAIMFPERDILDPFEEFNVRCRFGHNFTTTFNKISNIGRGVFCELCKENKKSELINLNKKLLDSGMDFTARDFNDKGILTLECIEGHSFREHIDDLPECCPECDDDEDKSIFNAMDLSDISPSFSLSPPSSPPISPPPPPPSSDIGINLYDERGKLNHLIWNENELKQMDRINSIDDFMSFKVGPKKMAKPIRELNIEPDRDEIQIGEEYNSERNNNIEQRETPHIVNADYFDGLKKDMVYMFAKLVELQKQVVDGYAELTKREHELTKRERKLFSL